MKVGYSSVVAAGALSLAIGFCIGNQLRVSSSNRQTTMPEFRCSAAFVSEVDTKDEVIVFVDEEGEAWVAGVDLDTDLSIDDKCVLIFDDMGTPDIHDDEIVAVF